MPRLCGYVEDLGLESIEGRTGAKCDLGGPRLGERERDAAAYAFGGAGDEDRVGFVGSGGFERVDEGIRIIAYCLGEEAS